MYLFIARRLIALSSAHWVYVCQYHFIFPFIRTTSNCVLRCIVVDGRVVWLAGHKAASLLCSWSLGYLHAACHIFPSIRGILCMFLLNFISSVLTDLETANGTGCACINFLPDTTDKKKQNSVSTGITMYSVSHWHEIFIIRHVVVQTAKQKNTINEVETKELWARYVNRVMNVLRNGAHSNQSEHCC